MALTRTPDPIRPTWRGPEPNRPSTAANKREDVTKGVRPGDVVGQLGQPCSSK